MQIIGVGHDEREEKAGRVCSTVGQTEGLPFVIGLKTKESYLTLADDFRKGVSSVASFHSLYKAI